MKVIIETTTELLAKDGEELLEGLTDEDKKEIAKSVLSEWLKGSKDFERQDREREVVEEIRNLGYLRGEDEQTIRSSADFYSRMRKFKSSRERLVDRLREKMITAGEKAIQELIKEEEASRILEKIVPEVTKSIPEFVCRAISDWVINNLTGILWNHRENSEYLSEVVKRIQEQVDP
jgi:hypothetical protein